MKSLQKLYEDGWITYHHVESSGLCPELLHFKGGNGLKTIIWKRLPKLFRSVIKTAHEAIRPTNINRQDEKNCLYHYIWRNAIEV